LVQALSGNLTVEFEPLTVDKEKYTGHYSIIVSFTCDQNLNNFCIEEKREILIRIKESVRQQTLDEGKTPDNEEKLNNEPSGVPENFIEMGFTGKLLIDKSLKSDFIGGNTLQIKVNKLHVTENPPKKLTFNKPAVKLTEDEERFLVLYAIEGVKNYAKIAEKMFCSEQTVKNWAQSIQSKLRANSMPHAIYLNFAPNSEDLYGTLY
jgi:DNA-binding CsgD family transcriptional regulator